MFDSLLWIENQNIQNNVNFKFLNFQFKIDIIYYLIIKKIKTIHQFENIKINLIILFKILMFFKY